MEGATCKMGAPRTRPQVLNYLMNHPGESLYIDDIAKATKLDTKQVLSAIGNLVHVDGEPVETVQRGRIWRYNPNGQRKAKAPEKRMFEEIGPAKDGSIVIQDLDGNLYKAVEL